MGLFQQMWEGPGGPPPNRAERRQKEQARKRDSRRATRAYQRRIADEKKGEQDAQG